MKKAVFAAVVAAAGLLGQTVEQLDAHGVAVSAATYQGKTAVRVDAKPDAANGESHAVVKGSKFHNGTIEVEVAGKPAANAGAAARGFIGIAFRLQGDRYEYIYLRPTNGRADDQVRRNHSTQYGAHPGYDFDRLRKDSPEKYESYVDLETGVWTRVRIEVEGTKARLYVHGAAQPCLIVNDMKMGDTEGAVALWVGPGTEGYFAGLKITPASTAADRLTLNGKVTDAAGKPLEGATVIVYEARVRQGYSTFCPSCYVDCGKRTRTAADGSYTIASLSPDLLFDVLVVHEGYAPAFVRKVDPASATATAALRLRGAVEEPGRVVRGVVVDAQGDPVRDAVVQPQGILGKTPHAAAGSVYGLIPGLEAVAVTNEKGEFELAHAEPFQAMVLQVEARGMAPKIATGLATGRERHRIVVTEGSTIRGRLVQDGKGVANAEVGVIARERGWGANLKVFGYPLPEMRVGTNEDGTFAMTNVPPGVEWYLYGKMESLAKRGGAPIRECVTAKDGEEIDVGELAVTPGLRLRGRVVLSDGAAIALGMRITIAPDRGGDSQTAVLGRDGSFEFEGLAKGRYTVSASVRGYRGVSDDPAPIEIDGDVTDYVLKMERR